MSKKLNFKELGNRFYIILFYMILIAMIAIYGMANKESSGVLIKSTIDAFQPLIELTP